NHYGTSPQFIPHKAGNGSQTKGYLVCMVHYGDGKVEGNGNEFWIFDAENLQQGPICKLWHPDLKLGFTVHTAWLPEIAPRTAHYDIPVELDYHSLVSQQPEEVQQLFRDWVYPQREPESEPKSTEE
ncbi:MAG: hypothetical protein F6K03_03245, partial [Kamptonema sp. SIO4C4]|nr:hypothetical protein [Kamptonema sp. SIO4C4]